jgi:dimethylargininase
MMKMMTISSATLRRSLPRHSVRHYTMALARQVSPQIENAVVMDDASVPAAVSYDVAHKQHQSYLQAIRCIVPTLELPYLADHPDCVFVEDTMVALGHTVVMSLPGHASRQGEVASMRDVVAQLGLKIVDMEGEATLDGGDVLYTGRHMYVGLSERTNKKGFKLLQDTFKDRTKVIPVDMPSSSNYHALHLKSVVTHLDEETLLAPTSDLGADVLTNMLDSGGYETLRLPSMLACNVVVANGHVMAQDVDCEESKSILTDACKERSLTLHWVNTSELAKVDGALSCCSVLLDA